MARTTIRTEDITDSSIQSLKNRNRIVNGAMNVDQRHAGTSVSVTNNLYITDRFKGYTTTGTYTGQQVSDAPAGFTKSLKLTVTTPQASLGAGDYYAIIQNIEGFNISDFNWGSADATAVTLSFWVKSSLTGTFSWTFQSGSFTTYVGTFSISSANTWQKVTASISGPTTGTWATDASTGIFFCVGLGNGSTYSTSTVNQWTSGNVFGATGQTNFISTNGATFYITGVQLEVGEVATPFEHEFFGDTVAKCQRYYCKSYNLDIVPQTNNAAGRHYFYLSPNTANGNKGSIVSFPVLMRSSPSVTIYNEASGVAGFFSNGSAANIIVQGQRSFMGYATTTGQDMYAHWVADAEL